MDPATEVEIARALFAATASTQTQELHATKTQQTAKPVTGTTQATLTATPPTQDATRVYDEVVVAIADDYKSPGVQKKESNLIGVGGEVANGHNIASVGGGYEGRWKFVSLKEAKELAPAEAEYWQIKMVLGRIKSGWRGYDAVISGEHWH